MAQALSYSRGANKFDNMPEQRTATDWFEFSAAVLGDRQPRKGMAFIAAPFALEGAVHHRCAAGCLPRAWHPLDVDEVTPDTARALVASARAFRGVGWTTHSHTHQAPRLRVVLALSRPVTREENVRLGRALERQLQREAPGLTLDQTVSRGEQPIYLPPTTCETWRFEGEALDVAALLAAVPPPPPVIHRTLAPHEVPDCREIGALLADIPNDGQGIGYDHWVAALAVVHRYLGDDGRTAALAFSERCERHDPAKFGKTWGSLSRPYEPDGERGVRPASIRTLQRLAALRYLPHVERA